MIAVPIFVVLAGLQFVAGRFPEALALDRLALQAEGTSSALWERPTRWEYDLRNALDEPVGRAECRLKPEREDETLVLDCHVQQAAFETEEGHGSIEMDETDLRQMIRWQRDDLHMMEGEAIRRTGEHRLTMRLESDGEGLLLSVGHGDGPVEELTLPDDVLLMGEWPWRLSALPFRLSHSGKATLAWPSDWREEGRGSGAISEDVCVVVRNAEPVWTPTGRFVAWRVTVGDRQTAWYNAEAPHTLVRYDDGAVTYLLVDVERESSTDE
jgi:hypothetical protein